MAYRWMKLYYEILDDPKMALLPDFLYRRTIELFLLAGRNGDDGALQPVAHMAWSLKVEEKRLVENLRSLEQIGVVAETEPGKWIVVNYAKRQSAEDSTERVKAFRSRKEQKKPPETDEKRARNDDETKRYTDKNKNRLNTERDIGDPIAEKLDECKFPFNPNSGVIIQGWKDDFPDDVILRAIDESSGRGAGSISYVDKVLVSWKANGVPMTREQQVAAAKNNPAKSKGNGKMSMDEFNASLARAIAEHPELG